MEWQNWSDSSSFFILSSLDLSELEAFEGLYQCFLQLLAKHVFFHRAKNSDYLLIFAEILFLYFSAIIQSLQFSSVTQLTLTLCDPMNHSTPGYLVHHQLPEFTQTHVHWVGDTIQPSHPLSPSPPASNPSQHQSLFQWVNSSHEMAKVLQFQLQHQSFQWTPKTDFHWILLLSPVTSTTGYCFCFGSIPSFFLELFLHWSPIACWAPTDLGSSSFSILSFRLFILFMGFSRQEY